MQGQPLSDADLCSAQCSISKKRTFYGFKLCELPQKMLDKGFAHCGLPKKTLDKESAHCERPKKTLDKVTAHCGRLKKTLNKESAHCGISQRVLNKKSAHDEPPENPLAKGSIATAATKNYPLKLHYRKCYQNPQSNKYLFSIKQLKGWTRHKVNQRKLEKSYDVA